MVTNKMSICSRVEYIKQVKPRYLKADKQEKKKILDEFCRNTGYNRKYAIRRLAASRPVERKKTFSRKNNYRYSNEDIYWLAKIWEIMDHPCGQRMEPELPNMMACLIRHKELNIPAETEEKLKRIRSDTIDRRLKPFRSRLRTKINSSTKPGSLVKKQIPIKTVSWDEQRTGCCELDLVAHCGDSPRGEFINSLTLTDILTGWTENICFLGKAQARIMAGLDDAGGRLPFPLIAIDPDNGSEFINWQLYRHCLERQIEFTRGRPYQKNDNAHVEQKNWSHVRKVFGYKRRETEYELNVMNDLYKNELRLYKNFFLPNVKLVEKKRIGKHGEKIKKVYDRAKTPFQRVLECDPVKEETKEELKKQYYSLNPAELRRSIFAKLETLDNFKINQPKTGNRTGEKLPFQII